MIRYCRACGEKHYFNYGENSSYCFTCDKEIEYKDTIANHTRDARVNQLKAMHSLMSEANDESIYITWICHVPDCPSEEDFEDIAIDDEEYNECFDLFVKLIAKEGNRY